MTLELKKKSIAAAILAGGNASRLGGIAKGTIENDDGICIVEQLIKELYKTGTNDIVVITNDSKPYINCGVKIIPDIRAGRGPIGGIEAALVYFNGRFDAVLFVPCDMPNLTSRELISLKKAFVETKNPVVFAQTEDSFWHPLCAVVYNDLKEMVSSAIDQGHRKIRELWKHINAEAVQFPDDSAFFNINNQADMEK
jgi:molybdopterin-guanine dinucleotide biosynthesis protein A